MHPVVVHDQRTSAVLVAGINSEYAVVVLSVVCAMICREINAGILFGLLRYRVRRDDLPSLSECDWDDIIRCGTDFSAHVCMSYHNSISREFAEEYAKR